MTGDVQVPEPAWLATVQIRLPWHNGWALPATSLTHLACGGPVADQPKVWGDLLCGTPVSTFASMAVLVGDGTTAPHARHLPCLGCAAAAHAFPDLPIAGPQFLADPFTAYAVSATRIDFPPLTSKGTP